MTIAYDADAVQYLVSFDPAEHPEQWSVRYHADDGTITVLEGSDYGDFEGLYFSHPIKNLYSWCLPSVPGLVRVAGLKGATAEMRHHG